MDRFTRNYLIGLGVVILLILIGWLSTMNPTVWELNDLLEEDPMLSEYPYQFRVLSLENGVAAMSSPRSSQMSAVRFVGIIHPELARKPINDPALIRAQKRLAEHQGHARKQVMAHPEVKRVKWVLDESWYSAHGISVSR